jgi:hypothetical protein
MKQYRNDRSLISIHIPKAGGTSLADILRRWFGRKFYLHYCDEKNNASPKRLRLEPDMCIHGHFNSRRGFGVRDYYPEVDQFITVLRDPFEIVVSRYFYEKKRAARYESYRGGKLLTLPDDINQYLEEEIIKPDYHPNILDYLPVEMTPDNFKENIHAYFVYIGIMEDPAFSFGRLAQLLGKPERTLPHLNPAERFAEADKHYRIKFIEAHPLEYALYNYVLENYKHW